MEEESKEYRPVKGFLGFPKELRLMIYDHLLVARERQFGGKRWEAIEIGTRRQPQDPIDFRHMSELVGMDTSYRRYDELFWFGNFPLSLTPQILQTCTKIRDEAAHILYGENTFDFELPDRCTRGQFYMTEAAKELQLRSQCLWLFGYREASWRTLFFEMQLSLFARFLHKIGKENAASLKAIRILLLRPGTSDGRNDPTIGKALNVVLQLLHIHVSGLRDLSVIFGILDLRPRSSQFLNGEFGRRMDFIDFYDPLGRRPCPSPKMDLYGILKEAIPKLRGLKNLAFRGFEGDPYVRRELERLEIVDGYRKDQVESHHLATDNSEAKTPNY